MNDTVKFQLQQMIEDCRVTPLTSAVAESRYARLSGYIDCLADCGVISSSEAVHLRDDALQAYIHGAAA